MVLTVVDRIDNCKEFLTMNFEQIDIYIYIYNFIYNKIFFYLTIITGHFA
jgi:hypothetical protein